MRRDVLSLENTFDRTFNDNIQKNFIPHSLKSFADQVLQEIKINTSHKGLEQSTLTIPQLITQSTVKHIRQNVPITNITHLSKSRERPVAIYTGMLLHATTRKKSLIEKFHKLGICVSYNRVLELSTTLGKNVLSHYNSTNIVCLPALKGGVFTSATLDNIDHNPGSTTAEGSFHGTGIPLFQHPTPENSGEHRHIEESITSQKNLLQLPANYANISPVSNFLKEPKISGEIYVETVPTQISNDITQIEERLVNYKGNHKPN